MKVLVDGTLETVLVESQVDNVTHITYNMWVERQNRKRERQTVLRLSHDSIAQLDRATAF